MLIHTINDMADNVPLVESRKRNKKRLAKEKRKHRIDFVLAAKNTLDLLNDDRREIFFQNLQRKRLRISSPVLSQDGHTRFWHVYAPFDLLCDVAEDLSVRLPTQENDLRVEMWYSKYLDKVTGCFSCFDPFVVKNSYFVTPPSYFGDIFDKNRLSEFHNGSNREHLFTPADRSRLVAYILESTPCSRDGNELGKSVLLNLGVFTAAYPCHDGPLMRAGQITATNMRQKLSVEWASFRKIFKYQPIDAIKDYFGVKIAFYFDWIGFYTTFLVPASVVGVICFLYGALSLTWFEPLKEICAPRNSSHYYMCPLCDKVCPYYELKETCLYAKVTQLFDNDATAFYAVFMSIWSVFYLEYWRRRQWCLSYKWHTMNFYDEEVVRPQYTAAAEFKKENPVTRRMEPFISKKEYFFKISGEVSVVFFFIALVIAATIGVVVYRAAVFGILLSSDGALRSNSRLVVTATAAVISLVVINILKYLYKYIARKLTEWENPRTRSAFEKSFTVKMFWFQFCNTYASVFYVAFFKGEHFVGWPGNHMRFVNNRFRLEGCSVQGCFLELCVQLVILMGGQQLLGNLPEVVIPYLKRKYNSWKHGIESPRDVPIWEEDYQLSDIENHEELSLFWEYQEVVLQYGFVTMFVAAFPLAPLIALVTNLIEIRIDAVNMVKTLRRPVAFVAEGIGVWYDILVTLTALGGLVNGFVLSLTSEFIPRLVYKYQFSPDRTLTGYVDWSLSYFQIKDFIEVEKPDGNIQRAQSFCRFPGFHESGPAYSFSKVHWEIWTIRLTFAFLFQWAVTGSARILAWIIPNKPRALDYKIKRQEYLARQAMRRYKIKTGKRLPEFDVNTADEYLNDCREYDEDSSRVFSNDESELNVVYSNQQRYDSAYLNQML